MRAFQSKHVEPRPSFCEYDAECERVAQDVNRQMLIGVNGKGIFNAACDGTTISINSLVRRGFRRCDFTASYGMAPCVFKLFPSTVSDEFHDCRDQLQHDLMRYDVEFRVQEDLKNLGTIALDKLHK
jgi:hypothetical protein